LNSNVEILIAIIGIISYALIGILNKKHAKNVMNECALNELFDKFCDCVSSLLLTDIFFRIYPISHSSSDYFNWLAIMGVQLYILSINVNIYTKNNKILTHEKFNGPVEILSYMGFLFIIKPTLSIAIVKIIPSIALFGIVICGAYQLYMIVFRLILNYQKTNDYATLFAMTSCIFMQVVKVFTHSHDTNLYNGLILSTLTADIILAKMAQRELHQLVPVMHLITTLIPKSSIVLVPLYFATNIYGVANHLCVPIINPLVNVFVSGYYDGFHVAHQLSLNKASRLGTRLIVGVHSQEDLNKKAGKKGQTPQVEFGILRHRAVADYSCVDEVIPNCSLMITRELIKKHKIHIVGMSDEYILERNSDGEITKVDKTYEVAFTMGILRVIPRTNGISSTELRKLTSKNNATLEELKKITSMIENINKETST
jgi:glycerol-3-phosphate cytidylyltransferase